MKYGVERRIHTPAAGVVGSPRVTPVAAGDSERASGGSELVAILFTDLVGSTELAVRASATPRPTTLRRDHFASLREAVAATGGTEVKTIGDALMASYPGAADALAGAVADAAGGRAAQPAPRPTAGSRCASA